MWATTCPKTKGLRCDCFIHYCTLVVALIACLILFILGSCEYLNYLLEGMDIGLIITLFSLPFGQRRKL